ncbi:MAG: PrsW family glutamic-type intramembrane protease [Xanthomonadales bacterium]|nr:PrsW family glutamic-type intramembrane protease [Xanthomonadales bacterium]
MSTNLIAAGLVALLPVLLFLGALIYYDSYDLVSPKKVATLISAGIAAGIVAHLVNLSLMQQMSIELGTYSRYLAPTVEEVLKATVIIALIKVHRIGFLIDAAIIGFAVGTGFALYENLHYLQVIPDAHIGVWLVRGFGTALMHAGTTGTFALASFVLVELKDTARFWMFFPGLAAAISIHSLYNHFFLSPILSSLLILVGLPTLLLTVYRKGAQAVRDWLDVGFDADAELLELINSGRFSESHVGRYLQTLSTRFRGEILIDLICYLRTFVELSLRAKGTLMLRESGFKIDADPDVATRITELKYLESSIGKTGLLAVQPFLRLSRKDLWQLYMLKQR